jgi:hypothetical protein
VSLFPSFFDEIEKALRRKGDKTSSLEVPVNVTVLREDIIDKGKNETQNGGRRGETAGDGGQRPVSGALK